MYVIRFLISPAILFQGLEILTVIEELLKGRNSLKEEDLELPSPVIFKLYFSSRTLFSKKKSYTETQYFYMFVYTYINGYRFWKGGKEEKKEEIQIGSYRIVMGM